MKKTTIKALIKSLIGTIITLFILNQINIIDYIEIVPEGSRYSIGLTMYLTIIETIFESVDNLIQSRKSYVELVFFNSKNNINADNTPVFSIDNNLGFVKLNYQLELSGNIKRLKKNPVKLNLPWWLNAQIESNNMVVNYNCNDNTLTWNFDELLRYNDKKIRNFSNSGCITLYCNEKMNDSSIELKIENKKYKKVNLKSNNLRLIKQ